MKASKEVPLVGKENLELLEACGAYYMCPKDQYGRRLGPLVGYTASYAIAEGSKEVLQYVGDIYINFARVEQYPHVLDHLAKQLAAKVKKSLGEIDYALAAPWGGLSLGGALARQLDSQYAFAEKKIDQVATERLQEQSHLILRRHEIAPGAKVIIVEDICNNFSTTAEVAALIQAAGGKVTAIICAVNRSTRDFFEIGTTTIPVISLIDLEASQYRQDDPEVQADIAKGNIILKPKHAWDELKRVMENFKPRK